MSCPTSACNKTLYLEGIPANPDVGGIGVVIAFLLSTWLTFAFYLMAFFVFNDGPINRLDSVFINDVRVLGKFLLSPFKRLWSISISRATVRNVALVLSDQQLITGASIFIAAYSDPCGITQYHFSIAYYLGSASFVTHQSALKIAGDSLRDYVFGRAWRMICVTAIFAFIFTSTFTIYSTGFTGDMLPLKCMNSVPANIPHRIDTILRVLLPFYSSIFLWIWGFCMVSQSLCPEAWTRLGRVFRPVFERLQWPFRAISIPRLYLSTSKKASATDRRLIFCEWWIINKLVFVPFLVYFTTVEILCSSSKNASRIGISLLYVNRRISRQKRILGNLAR